MCCCEVTMRIYGKEHTSKNRDNLIAAIKKIKSGVIENESLNLQGIEKKSGRQKKLYLVSYDAFKKLCIQHNEELIDYYLILEKMWFKVSEWIRNIQIEESK